LVKEARSEAHVPAQQPASRQTARLSHPDAHPRRPGDHPDPPPEGSGPVVGLIWRIRDRATFEALRREGRRVRRGDVSVAYVPDGGKHPRLAYGVGRKVGTAVVRNRVRRRLRSAAQEVARARGVAPGAYLVTVRPGAADLPYARLRHDLDEALAAAASRSRRHPPGGPSAPGGMSPASAPSPGTLPGGSA
jgi:ribonuclease P protein component